MSTNISLTMGTLSKSCYGDLQEYAVDLVSQMTGTVLDGSLKYIISETAPGADDRDKLWIKTSSGAPVRQYIFYNGAWVWPHHIPAGDTKLQIYKGSADSVATLDGGTAGAVRSSSGPFWEIDTDLSGKFPLGAGTLPSGTEVDSGTTGGSETVTLTSDQLPDHGHLGEAYYRAQAGPASTSDPSGLADATLHENSGHTNNASYNSFNKAGVITTSMSGTSGQAHNNMPPYYGVYFIKRTARQYYVG
jgi:hypothetical protein